jgi:hypothetical protein
MGLAIRAKTPRVLGLAARHNQLAWKELELELELGAGTPNAKRKIIRSS